MYSFDLTWRLEIIILILIFIFFWELLSSLGEVNVAATSAATDDVIQVDLLHIILIRLIG